MAIGIRRTKIEAGQGGRLGHSNMTHWDYTEHIKAASRKARRLQSKAIIRQEVLKLAENGRRGYQPRAGSNTMGPDLSCGYSPWNV